MTPELSPRRVGSSKREGDLPPGRRTRFVSRNRILYLMGLLCLVAAGCGQDWDVQEVDLGPAREIEGLVKATAQRIGGEPPRVLGGVAPQIAADVRQALESQEFQAVVRVMITADSSVMGVAVLEFAPQELELAGQYADQVADSIWQWKFDSARKRGDTTRDYLDLHFRQGGVGAATAP
jgi:hypothetical protein